MKEALSNFNRGLNESKELLDCYETLNSCQDLRIPSALKSQFDYGTDRLGNLR